MPSNIGAPGKEQFSNAIMSFRNLHIHAALNALFLFRSEVIANDELSFRGGADDKTRDHFFGQLINCDRWRRRVTHNPENQDLGTQIEKAINAGGVIEGGGKPFGSDNVQHGPGGMIVLSKALDGSDPDLPLFSMLNLRSANCLTIVGGIDVAIVEWTRLESRFRRKGITVMDSMRIYGTYQDLYGFIDAFLGDKNLVDVAAGVLATEEPRGPLNAPNRVGEQPFNPIGQNVAK